MKQLSSKSTFTYKKVIPVFWFGCLAMVICVGLFVDAKGNGGRIIFVVAPIVMMVFGYFFMKKVFWDLIDEVYDLGTDLLFRNKGMEFLVNLRDIKNISYNTWVNDRTEWPKSKVF